MTNFFTLFANSPEVLAILDRLILVIREIVINRGQISRSMIQQLIPMELESEVESVTKASFQAIFPQVLEKMVADKLIKVTKMDRHNPHYVNCASGTITEQSTDSQQNTRNVFTDFLENHDVGRMINVIISSIMAFLDSGNPLSVSTFKTDKTMDTLFLSMSGATGIPKETIMDQILQRMMTDNLIVPVVSIDPHGLQFAKVQSSKPVQSKGDEPTTASAPFVPTHHPLAKEIIMTNVFTLAKNDIELQQLLDQVKSTILTSLSTAVWSRKTLVEHNHETLRRFAFSTGIEPADIMDQVLEVLIDSAQIEMILGSPTINPVYRLVHRSYHPGKRTATSLHELADNNHYTREMVAELRNRIMYLVEKDERPLRALEQGTYLILLRLEAQTSIERQVILTQMLHKMVKDGLIVELPENELANPRYIKNHLVKMAETVIVPDAVMPEKGKPASCDNHAVVDPKDYQTALMYIAIDFLERKILDNLALTQDQNVEVVPTSAKIAVLKRIHGLILDNGLEFRITRPKEGEFGIPKHICKVQLVRTLYPTDVDMLAGILSLYRNIGH